MAGGRPTKYKPEYCQMLVDHMATGMPFDTFAAIVDVDRDTIKEWAKVHKQFSAAKKKGRAKQHHAMVKLGLAGSVGKIQTPVEQIISITKDPVTGQETERIVKRKMVDSFNPTPWIFIMKNCFGWKDRIEFTEEDEIDEITFDG